MHKVESIKVMFHTKDDGLSPDDILKHEEDGWEVQYLLHPSEVPLMKNMS